MTNHSFSIKDPVRAILVVLAVGFLGAPSPALSKSSDAQFKRHYEAGRYAKAERLGKRLLKRCEARHGRNHRRCAYLINDLAVAYAVQAKYAEAEGLYRRAVVIYRKAQGANHPHVATALHNLAKVHHYQGRYADAEDLFQRVLAIDERAHGSQHPNVATTLNSLALVYRSQGKYEDAESLFRQALKIQKKALGPRHADVATTLDGLALVYADQGRYADAEDLFQRAQTIYRKALGARHPNVARNLNNLALAYVEQGKYAGAEDLYRRALAIHKKAQGADHPDVATTLGNLGAIYEYQEKYGEADGLYRRALAIREKALGADHPRVAATLASLGAIYWSQDKFADAEDLYRRALEIKEKARGPDHPHIALTLNNLAETYRSQEKYADAERLYQRARAIVAKALGANHPGIAKSLNDLALVYQDQGKYEDAERRFRRALAIRERTLGASHPEAADTLHNLASLSNARRDHERALAYSRRAAAAVIAHAATETPGSGQSQRKGGLIEQRAHFFRDHVFNLAQAVRQKTEADATAGREAAEMAQWAVQSSAGDAISQMALRFTSGRGPLARLVRKRQDLAAAWRERDKALLAALSKPEKEQDSAGVDAIRRQIVAIEAKLTAVDARLDREFPEYAALTRPKPLKVAQAQSLLGADEALVFFLPGEEESYVFAMTREGFEWKPLPLGSSLLADKVAAFRKGLDVREVFSNIRVKPRLFDLALAHELYGDLIGPVEPLIKDKRHLLFVPAGSLTALPFHLLITEKPAVPQVKDALKPETLRAYRSAAWLIKRQAVTVLPSVASLKALRVFARKGEAKKPIIGFGDPVFAPDPGSKPPASPRQRGKIASAPAGSSETTGFAAHTRSYSEFWRGVEVDRDKLARILPPLPESADELKTIAQELGVPMSDIHLGRNASETMVKRTPLADYRIVYFATHGLVAGDVKGLGEPSLALTLPKKPSDLDDGLLTASEVANLKLDADWVVLSACNTIAGEKPGAQALSGLARAFFYAGARALLVSHWAVETNAATRLTTATFEIMESDPRVGRAEALRRAMLDYLNDESNPMNAYPAFWGPFSIVGEGARRSPSL